MIFPPSLQKGDYIGVMSTSCWVEEQDILTAKTFIENQGYRVYIHPQATARLHQSAGSAEEKVAAFHDLIANPDIKAIFSSRGGNRASTMIDTLDFDLIRQNPKIIIGYSDLTILLNAITAKCGFTTYHGPLFRELPTHPDYNQMMAILSGKIETIDLSSATVLRDGTASGTLLGGNMSVLQGLIGTPYAPDFNGAILILEDVADHISRYDRMLCHFRNSGILEHLSGLIIGSFTDVKDSDTRPFGFSLADIIEEHTKGLDIPILMDAPFGHGERLITLPIGAKAVLKNGELSFKSS